MTGDARAGLGAGPWVGVDIGTTLTKAACFDAKGGALALAERPTRLDRSPGGRVEQDPDEVLASVAAVVGEVADHAGGPTPSLLALTGQGDGCWLVDAGGRAVRPAISWMDGRAGAQLGEWERDGTADAVFRRTGNALFPGSQACLLAWLAAHEPRALERAATAAYCKDVILQRLTGLRATDPTSASTPFGDPGGRGYDRAALEACGLAGLEDLLAPVRPLPWAPLSAEGADLVGLQAGTPVAAGPYDLPACAAGAGLSGLGSGILIAGTTLACQVLVDRVETTGEAAGFQLAGAHPGRWLRAMPAMVGTACLDWVLELLGLDHGDVDGLLAESGPGAAGVEMLPYLAPSGERAPFVDHRARGQLTGLSLATTRADVVRGVCEGVALAARDCFEAAGLEARASVCGGGSRSRPWLQIFADVLGRPLDVARTPDVGARGAVLAALDPTLDDPITTDQAVDADEWTRPEDTVAPDGSRAEHYAEAYDRYLAHRRAAAPLWRDA